MPQVDTQQDYELISLTEEDGKTIMKIKRKFDTCDSEDNKIEVSELSLHFVFLFSNSQLLRKSGLVPGSLLCIQTMVVFVWQENSSGKFQGILWDFFFYSKVYMFACINVTGKTTKRHT